MTEKEYKLPTDEEVVELNLLDVEKEEPEHDNPNEDEGIKVIPVPGPQL